MKTLFGITFGKRDETDEQYIERIRKNDRTVRKLKPLWLVVGLAHIALVVAIVVLFQRMIEFTKDYDTGSRLRYWIGFMVGLLFGVWCGTLIVAAGIHIKTWRDSKHGFRTERLLLEYYDMVKRK